MVCLCEEHQYIYDQTDSCVRDLDHPVGLQEAWIVYNYNAVVSYIADFCSFEPALLATASGSGGDATVAPTSRPNETTRRHPSDGSDFMVSPSVQEDTLRPS
ncbi:unnamed protein product [Parascedosporium putredinis]|uniref:Uncharacterized protein n=1 Tax=Parascedosporium putredinis TaxID=1442378 RepID=A0A9P1GY31_9PEZI|nr:unnamed protein product [Parascedosporium putredinis]CAI7990347.1 unnamed protein product [Parascedosporium putredinis]